jgi:hypothetical protein
MIKRDDNIFEDADGKQRLQELLAGAVLGDLSDEEREELILLEPGETQAAREELELTAALVDVTIGQIRVSNAPELSGKLRSQILDDADDFFAERNAISSKHAAQADLPSEHHRKPTTPTVSARERMAWLAFAASLLLALGLWFTRPESAAFSTPAKARLALLNSSDDLIQSNWTAGKTPFENPVRGDVVWSNTRQTGFMRFVGMPINDPNLQQYQLWIIDPLRDDEPIDGGVFNVSSSGEVIVPIDAKLQVIEPAAFAITIEKPGGVVVSSQDRLPLLASVE